MRAIIPPARILLSAYQLDNVPSSPIHRLMPHEAGKQRPPSSTNLSQPSYDNADKSSVAVVDYFLHGILQFCLAFVVDHGDFVTHSVHDQFFDRFSEDVGTPYASVGSRFLL